MIKPGTYPYQGGPYSLSLKGKKGVLTNGGDKVFLEKQLDGTFLFTDSMNYSNYLLIQDREHFHVLDSMNLQSNKNKTNNYGIEFDAETLGEYLRDNTQICKIIDCKNIFTREPLKEPSDRYLFINIFMDREYDKKHRICLGDIRIIGNKNDTEESLTNYITAISNILSKLQNYKTIKNMIVEGSPVILKHSKLYIIQNLKIIYEHPMC